MDLFSNCGFKSYPVLKTSFKESITHMVLFPSSCSVVSEVKIIVARFQVTGLNMVRWLTNNRFIVVCGY